MTPMTPEERFAQIEHITAGIAEERRRDREEYKALWRDTQRQIDLLATETRDRIDRLADVVREMAEENRAEHERLRKADERLRQADEELKTRVDALVSAIGQYIATQPPRQ